MRLICGLKCGIAILVAMTFCLTVTAQDDDERTNRQARSPEDKADEQREREIMSQLDLGKHTNSGCGPTSIYNWLSHGDSELQNALADLSSGKTPVQTAVHVIETYGSRPSLHDHSKTRYGNAKNYAGIGPINAMALAQDILRDHSTAPTKLRGEFLQRLDNESAVDHLNRVTKLFSASIEAGIPILLHIRCYRLNPAKREKKKVFGHYEVITSIEAGLERASITCIEPSGGYEWKGLLQIAKDEFTAPTYSWRFRNGRAIQSSKTKTGRPLLVISLPRAFNQPGLHEPGETIVVANFATFSGTEKE